jgi:hypothetical protein
MTSWEGGNTLKRLLGVVHDIVVYVDIGVFNLVLIL